MILSRKNIFTYLSYKATYSFQTIKLFIIFRIVDPFIHYIFYSTLATALIGTDYLKYVLIGNIAFYSCQTIIVNFLSMFRQERQNGTLELNIASPMNTFLIILRKSIVPLLDGLFVFILGLLFGKVIFGLSYPIEETGSLFLIMIISLFSIISFGLMLSCISLLFSNINLFLNIILASLQVLCGVHYSVSLLPESLEFFTRLLPLTHSIEALRTIYNLESFNILSLMLKELSIGIIYFFLSTILITVMEKLARRSGALLKNI